MMTVASSQVPVPLIWSPSDSHAVTTRATKLEINAERPVSDDACCIAILMINGWATTLTPVKMRMSRKNALVLERQVVEYDRGGDRARSRSRAPVRGL